MHVISVGYGIAEFWGLCQMPTSRSAIVTHVVKSEGLELPWSRMTIHFLYMFEVLSTYCKPKLVTVGRLCIP